MKMDQMITVRAKLKEFLPTFTKKNIYVEIEWEELFGRYRSVNGLTERVVT